MQCCIRTCALVGGGDINEASQPTPPTQLTVTGAYQ